MSLLETAVARPVATTLLMTGLTLIGAVAFFLLPVAPVPQIDYPMITVVASMPGASPQTMAASVATPLEKHLGKIASVNEMTSTSSLGSARISLQLDLDRDINGAQRDVQAAIAAARADLPTSLRNNPTTRATGPADVPVLTLSLTSSRLTQGQLFDAASNILQQKLAQVPGVSQVSVSGGALPAVRVELNPHALFKYGISLEDVRAALAATNYSAPKGAVTVDERRLQIYCNDQQRRADDYTGLVVAYRNGATIRLSDLAEVVDSVEDSRSFGLVNDEPGIQVNVSRAPGANNIEIVDAIRALLPALNAALPAGAEMRVMRDRTLTIRTSLHEVEQSLVIAVTLVILVVFLFLRDWRATLVPGISVIVSLVGSFGAMYLLDYTLDNLSLMALTIATGFIVDDAIVVVENVVRHMESGTTRLRAVIDGSREVVSTVLSMSLSLIAVFIPVLFMGGFVGRMLHEFAVTLSVAILISLALSVTATPMLCAQLMRAHSPRSSSRILRASEWTFAALQRGYEHSLEFALRRPRLTMLALVATVGLNFHLLAIIPKGFFPTQDTGRMSGALVADQSVSFSLMKTKLEQFIAVLRNDPGIETVAGTIGGSSFGPSGSVNVADMQVTLKPLRERGVSADEIIARLRPKLAKLSGATMYLQSTQDVRIGGRPSNALYQFTLQSDDLEELQSWAPKVTEALRRNPVLQDVSSDQQDKGLQTSIHVVRATASRFKLTSAQIDNTLYDAFGQRQVSTIYEPLNQYHVVMEVAPQYRDSVNALDDLYLSSSATLKGSSLGAAAQVYSVRSNEAVGNAVNASADTMVPLPAFSRLAGGKTPLQVNHQGNFAAITVSFNLSEGKSLSDATRAITETMEAIGTPAAIHGVFAGTAASYQDALANQPLLIAAALTTVYIVLGILYESFLYPITILSTAPSAGVGALLALMACKTDLSIVAMIGVLLLIGIVKKNAIMLVDFAVDVKRRTGVSATEAIRQACACRFRPILMTTVVALLSALPLAFGTGEGSEIRRPLGIAVTGGLIVSQFLTLYTTPVIYLYIDRLQSRLSSMRRGAERFREEIRL